MQKKWLIALVIMLLLIASTGSVFAWSGRVGVDGRPAQFYPGGPTGYYIWQDESGFHFWTAARDGERHIFRGVIRTDGSFYQVRGHRLENGDSFTVYSEIEQRFWFRGSEGRGGNHFAFGGREVDYDNNNKLAFKFDNASGFDGLRFRVADAHYITFELFMDGYPINHRQIFIGEQGWHPQHHEFRFFP